MTISIKNDSLKAAFNAANPNTLPSEFQKLKIGDVLRALPTYLRGKLPVVNPGNLGTLQALALPDDAKALTILRAYARTATAGAGELAVQAFGATPTTGQIAVAPNGNIVVLAADAILDLDVVYIPEKVDVVEFTLPVAAGVLTIPTVIGGVTNPKVVTLLEAEGLAGTIAGNKIVLVPGTAPATLQARLNVAKTQVLFNSGTDGLTSARVKLGIACAVDVDALLTNSSVIA